MQSWSRVALDNWDGEPAAARSFLPQLCPLIKGAEEIAEEWACAST
jgi:hypothetical protein